MPWGVGPRSCPSPRAPAPVDPHCLPRLAPNGLEELVLAHKDLAHRLVRKDVLDGAREDRCDIERLYLRPRLILLQGQRVRNDDLLEGGVFDLRVGVPRELAVGGSGADLEGAFVNEALRGIDQGPASSDYVVDH